MSPTDPRVNIPRFVRPRSQHSGVQAVGYLPDPETPYGKVAAPSTIPLSAAFSHGCVVVLGEPGIGKSDAFVQRQAELGVEAVFADLRWEESNSVLRSEQVMAWQRGDRKLHIVIDSLDEASDPNFANLLVGMVKKGPTDTLTMELACRAGEWPRVLETQLPLLFGSARFNIFVLEPLRRADVAAFAEALRLDSKSFLTGVEQSDLQALAARPLTLLMLLRIFRAENALPADAGDLYEKACLELCREQSDSRNAAKPEPPDANNRLAVAEWLATASAACRRTVFVADMLAGESSQEREIDAETVANAVPGLTTSQVRDALRAGLFTSVGLSRWGWVHQAFSEFLSARWMTQRLSVEQRTQVVTHPDARDVVPRQLLGLASWLCCLDPDVASWVAQRTPELLLAAPSPPPTSEADRSVAVEMYLARVRSREALSWWWQSYQLRRFDHPGLADQLGSILASADEDVLVRRVAIDIAEASSANGLYEATMALAENRSLPAHVRAAAIEASWSLASDKSSVLARLRALAEARDASDPEERVRAAAIEALWPGAISPEDLLHLLSPPVRDNVIGEYQSLFWKLPATFDGPAIAAALRWARQRSEASTHGGSLAVERLIILICRRALAYLDDPGICQEFGETAGVILMNDLTLFGGDSDTDYDFSHNDDTRLKIVTAIVQYASKWSGAFRLVHPYGQPPLIGGNDLPWLIERFRNAGEAVRARWADMVREAYVRSPTMRGLDLILDEVGEDQHSPLLPFPRFLVLGSDEAQDARKGYVRLMHMEREMSQHRSRQARPEAAKGARLESNVKRDSWWRFVCHAAQEAGFRKQCSPLEFPAWQEVDENERALLIRVGKAFLCEYDAPYHMWIHEPHAIYYPAHAAVLTLMLLRDVDPNWMKENETVLAAKWAPAVAGFEVHQLQDEQQRDSYRQLVMRVTCVAPFETATAVRVIINRERKRSDADLSILSYLPPGSGLGAVVRTSLQAGYVSLSAFRQLLAALLRFDPKSGLLFAQRHLGLPSQDQRYSRRGSLWTRRRAHSLPVERQWVRSPYHAASSIASDRAVNRRLHVCTALMQCGGDGWRVLSRAAQRHPNWARAVTLDAVDRSDIKVAVGDLEPTELGSIYRWLCTNWRPERTEERDWEKARLHSLLDVLVERSTQDAVAELQRLRELFPFDDAVALRLPDAVRRYHDSTWSPPTFEQLASLSHSSDKRLVRSSAQLLDAVIDALHTFERTLHAETPAVGRLWNYSFRQGNKTYQPKDENDFSDEVKLSLQQTLRGVIVNREVEIRPTEASRIGQRVDLLVEAIDHESQQRLAVVVEIKGSWHDELETALEDQLVARYLTRGQLTHGIYLVGWYSCDTWDNQDGRRAKSGRRDQTQISDLLREQAARASDAVRKVEVVIVDTGIRAPQAAT